jgi:hypothetical protein
LLRVSANITDGSKGHSSVRIFAGERNQVSDGKWPWNLRNCNGFVTVPRK